MELEFGKVFNLMDTNGRRADVINAFELYLSFLKEGNENDTNYEWAFFPKSLNQFLFYKKAIESSPDVFVDHPKFDYFQEKYHKEIESFISGDKYPLISNISSDDKDLLGVAIESRARHYSSNLCKLGLIRSNRKITPAGFMFLDPNIHKDKFESILPLTSTNLSLIRQLMKLRIYSKEEMGTRSYYSPFYFAVYLLLKYDHLSVSDFKSLIQSTSPYSKKTPEQLIEEYFNNTGEAPIRIDCPSDIKNSQKISLSVFEKLFTNSKSSSTVKSYWEFYNALYNFKNDPNIPNFSKLEMTLKNPNWFDKIKKAFGFGKPIFDLGERNYITEISFFTELNKKNELLSSKIEHFNEVFYKRFIESKYFDLSLEYSDTTKRMLSATGLFKFEKGLSKLAYKELLAEIFEINTIKNLIFGISSEAEYLNYEGNDDSNYYSSIHSMSEIMFFDQNKTSSVISLIEKKFGSTFENITDLIRDKTNKDFKVHVGNKYPRRKVLELLKLFDDRNNDSIIRNYVNPEATVPTIYEYITALAWYYLSEEKINVYDSLNLTLNADFEPVLHASGGDGDIIVKEGKNVTMLEVTLLNRSSQGRAELEPVIRHSINLKARFADFDTMTFFIASELDTNTTNIWRYILTQDQIATLNSTVVNGIIIMSFTNKEICDFIEKNITTDLITKITKQSFVNGIPEYGWREKIVSSLI